MKFPQIQKIGSWLVIVLGLLVSLALVVLALIVYLGLPEADMTKKALVGAGCLLVAGIVALISIALFESMQEINHLEEEVEVLEQEIEGKNG